MAVTMSGRGRGRIERSASDIPLRWEAGMSLEQVTRLLLLTAAYFQLSSFSILRKDVKATELESESNNKKTGTEVDTTLRCRWLGNAHEHGRGHLVQDCSLSFPLPRS